MSEEDYKEICGVINGMCESAIASSKLTMIDDSVHKEGLVHTLKDIMDVIKDIGK